MTDYIEFCCLELTNQLDYCMSKPNIKGQGGAIQLWIIIKNKGKRGYES